MGGERKKKPFHSAHASPSFSSLAVSVEENCIEVEPSLTYECLSATVPFEKMYQSEDRINFPLQDLSTFPQDYIVIEKFPKLKTEQEGSEIEQEGLSPFVKVCFNVFTSDWTLIRTNICPFQRHHPETSVYQRETPYYEGDKTSDIISNPLDVQEQKSFKYTILQDPDNPLQEDDLYFTLREERSSTKESKNEVNSACTGAILECFDPNYDWHPGTEIALCNRIRKTLRPDIKNQHNKPFYFTVLPKTVVFGMGDVEPFFCSLSLFDFATKKKISENYFFHCNSPITLCLLGDNWTIPEENIDAKKALFSVRRRTANVFLVLQVYKVLHGDPEVSIEPYSKVGVLSKPKDIDKIKGKIRAEATEYCAKYGRFKQPFGISALQVFDNKGHLLLNEETQFTSIYARSMREDIFTALQLFADPKENRKNAKDLRGSCGIAVQKISELQDINLFDPSLRNINTGEGEPVLQIHEFPQQPRLFPNFSYVNNLYLYPISANMGKLNAKTVCIKVEVKAMDNFDSPTLKCFYSPSRPTGFVSKIFTSTEFHSKSPCGDEIKLCLPPKLSEKHHLLFSFLDIPIGGKKKKDVAPSIIGYAIVPLYENGRIVVNNSGGVHTVPIYSKLELNDYISKATTETRASFQLHLELESTVYPEDPNVADFFNVYSDQTVSDKDLIDVLKRMHDLSGGTAIQYFCVIVNNLLEVMCTREDHTVQLEAFRSLVLVAHKVRDTLKERTRNSLLELYSNYAFNQTVSGQAVFNAICSNFLLYMMDKKYQRADEVENDSVFANSWFFFDLVIKSMVLHLDSKDKLNQDNRTALFDDFFSRTLSRLLVNLTKYFKEHMFASESIRVLNKNLALFMKDLLDVIDRGIVLDMIRSYLTEMTDPALKSDKEICLLAAYKFEFLRIISDHESYVLLNLPFRPFSSLHLSDLTQNHPIAFTVIFEVIQALKSPHEEIWRMAIGTLYDTVIKHYSDVRYASPDRKKVIARIFFVLIPLLLDNWTTLIHFKESASSSIKRELYVCVLYILENSNRTLLHDWWKNEPPHMQVSFMRLLTDVIQAFYYDPSLIRPTKTLLTPEVALFMNEVGTEEMTNLLKGATSSKIDPAKEDKRLRWLTIRADFLLLDILEDFVMTFQTHLASAQVNSFLFSGIVDAYCALAGNKPNEHFIPIIYEKLHVFVRSFSKILFLEDNNYLRQLLRNVILHCNSTDRFTYIRGTTLLFSIFQLNQRTTGDFALARIQTVATLSDLVSSRELTEDRMLNHSFRRLVYYALHSFSQMETEIIKPDTRRKNRCDAEEMMASFTRNIQEIVLTLASILRDTLRVAQLTDEGEPHMKMDLYLQIAEGYKNSPDLRIKWLKDLATLQAKHGGCVEAGMVHLQCAIIIAEHLLSAGQIPKSLVPWDLFQSVFPVVKEFGETPDVVVQSTAFTLGGLVDALRTSVKYFKQGEYFEYASQILKIICPIYEHTQSCKNLASSYSQLQDCWKQVNEIDTERLFGKYFRVGFYGEKFGDLNRLEFIYKEPKLTHILDMSDRLKTFYKEQIGEEIFTLDASKSVENIDSSKCYLQITHMEPFRDISETKNQTFFQRNTRLSRFYFETPFTLSGKAHAENVAEQYKRKTVLVVTDSFPHMLCRLPVASKYDIIVSPIENAIEDIEKRNVLLETEIEARQPVTLRQVLQGSVLLQVNEGAVAVCKIFLGSYHLQPKQHVLRLCECMTNFLNLCRVALAQNKSFAKTEDDTIFHQAMLNGFRKLESEISSLLRGVIYDAELSDTDTSTFDEDDLSIDSDIPLRAKPSKKKSAKSHRRSRSMDTHSLLKQEKYNQLRELPSDDYQPPIKSPKMQLSAKDSPAHPSQSESALDDFQIGSRKAATPNTKRKQSGMYVAKKFVRQRSQTASELFLPKNDSDSPRNAPKSPRFIESAEIETQKPPSPRMPPPPPPRRNLIRKLSSRSSNNKLNKD